LEERGHSVTLSLPGEAIYLDADAARLEQVVANLLTNAAKYTDPGGSVTVAAERDGDSVAIRVRDNGIGIAPEMLPHVFELFTQGERSLDRPEGGLGIGLTLVRSIVELHGGKVEATSSGIGNGAEFIIRLPALPAGLGEANVNARELERKPFEGHSARVLIVEDNSDAGEALGMLLELLGHHVRVVQDGARALEAARANIPDIMLVDIGLPGMNGYEFARAVRRDEGLKHLILVALTGYGRPEDTAKTIAAGFDYHLVKPVEPNALSEIVSQFDSSQRLSSKSTRH
jgi:CheY-like chemotaxis protein/anti-sigma regulatory factor (Ser/Thr protein kinase)